MYNKIPNNFSEDLNLILKMCLKVNSNERPTCSELLNHNLLRDNYKNLI